MLVAHYADEQSSAEAWLVVDTFLHGVAGGGIRMDPQVNQDLVRLLASTMSVKLSMVQPPLGGAKCGIRFDPRAPGGRDVLRRVVRAFAPFLRTCWVTGSDLGTDWNDVVTACRDEAGIPHPQYALMKAYAAESGSDIDSRIDCMSRGTSLLVDYTSNLNMSNAVTGWTVCAATEEALRVHGESLRGKRVAIQGFGAVGGSAAKFLAEAGAVVTAVSDELGAVVSHEPGGLDISRLFDLRELPARKVLSRERIRALFGYEFTGRDAVLYQPVDVLIPAAGSNIPIDIHQVQARYIIEAANDPFSEATEEFFSRRGIVVVPDAVANAGNAGLFGLLAVGNAVPTKELILATLREQVQKMTRLVLENRGTPPRRALNDIAVSHIRLSIEEGHSFMPQNLSERDLMQLSNNRLHIEFSTRCPYLGAEPERKHTSPLHPSV